MGTDIPVSLEGGAVRMYGGVCVFLFFVVSSTLSESGRKGTGRGGC